MLIKSPKSLDLSRRRLITDSIALTLAYGALKKTRAQAQGCGPFWPAPPPQVVAVGTAIGKTPVLVFSDDFTTTDTFATSATQNFGGNTKWFYGFAGDNPGQSVNTTQTAAQLASSLNLTILPGGPANGQNTGGGYKPSPFGGIVSLKETINPTYDSWISVPGNYYASLGDNSRLPPVGQGNWNHFYVEVATLFNVATAAVVGGNYSWPSFWSGTAERMGFDFGNGLGTTNDWIEWDYYESFGQNFNNPNGVSQATIHHWQLSGGNTLQPATQVISLGYPAHSGTPVQLPFFDNNWHVVGGMWSPDPNNSGKGLVSAYFDDVQYGSVISTGGVGSTYPLEVLHQFLIMPGPGGTPVYNDYVNVWQWA
jgi:hypothetical protein